MGVMKGYWRTVMCDSSVPGFYNNCKSSQQASWFEKAPSPKNQARLPFHFLTVLNREVLGIGRERVGLLGPWGFLPAVWSLGEARAPQLLAQGWNS